MPRSSNSKSSQTTPLPRRAPSPAPSPSPSLAPSQGPSMLDSMKQGFGFGVGSAIAHNIFRTKNKDETINKTEITNETKLTNDKIYELYNKCLENNDNNIDCKIILQNTNNK